MKKNRMWYAPPITCVLSQKLLLVMRLSFLLLFSIMLQVSAGSLAQKVVIKEKKMTYEQLFLEIELQTGIATVLSNDEMNMEEVVFIEDEHIELEALLQNVTKGTDLTYEIIDNYIVIRPLTFKEKVALNAAQQSQELIVTGKVTDETGQPIPGATIYIKGFQKPLGTISDINGEFSLDVKIPEAVLIISFIGMETQEITVGSQKVISVTLISSTEGLEEVVVVGYGTQKRSEISSAISSVDNKKLSENVGANASFDRALGGLAKGVRVVEKAGAPGSGVDINIRGITSPFSGSDNNPLFVIDGVPFQTNPLGLETVSNPLLSINPNDIESIDVLKDASATAIYGSRGANGVIIVKTKKGRKGEKMKVSVSATATVGEPIKLLDYANTSQYRAYAEKVMEDSFEAFQNGQIGQGALQRYDHMINLTPGANPWDPPVGYTWKDNAFGTANTNWADEVYRNTSLTQQYNASVTGGTENTSMILSMSYTDQEGLVKEEEFEQMNVRLGIDANLNSITKVGANINIGSSERQSGYGETGSINSGALYPTLNTRPDLTPYQEGGSYTTYETKLLGEKAFFPNPVALLKEQDNNTTNLTVLGNAYLQIEPIKNLQVKAQVSASRFSGHTRNFDPRKTLTGAVLYSTSFPPPSYMPVETRIDPLSSLLDQNVVNTNQVLDLTATYGKTINKHSLSGMLGYSWDRSRATLVSNSYEGFPDDKVLTDPKSAVTVLPARSSDTEIGMNSMFARFTYSYDQRYYLTANFRTDRSARFGPKNQRAYFPSVSGGWAISNEDFLSSSEVIDNLRLRAGWGNTGSNNIPNFAYLQFFNINPAAGDPVYAGEQAVGINNTLANPDIQWEMTEEVNFGLDFGLFKNRLRGSVDVYDRKSTDVLLSPPFSIETGVLNYTANFADLSNKGFEIEVGGDIIKTDDVIWSASVNVSKNKNTIDKLAGNTENLSRDGLQVGREVGFIYGYVVEGIIQKPEELKALNDGAPDGVYQEAGTGVGDYRFKDISGPDGEKDGKITVDDQTYLGSGQADFFGGFNTSVAYKNFELSAYFNFSSGGEAYVPNNLYPILDRNVQTRFLNTWTKDNSTTTLPRAIMQDPNNNARRSSADVYSTSYIRLKNVQLKYNLPANLLSKLRVERAHLFVAGANLWTHTDFPGIDPELLGGAASGSSSTNNPYPLAKTWSLGINLNF